MIALNGDHVEHWATSLFDLDFR